MATETQPATNNPASCQHLPSELAGPRGAACEECGSERSLRVCLDCGHVGCCESQAGHNTAHSRASGHAVIKSMPVGPESFVWCYSCNRYLARSARPHKVS